MRRAWRWLAIGIAALLAIVALALVLVDTQAGHRWVARRIAAVEPASGLRIAVGRIDGSLYTGARIVDLRVSDLDGLMLQAPRVELDWRPWRWFANTLAIDRLVVPDATLFHVPRTRPGDDRSPILPRFDIAIGQLRVDRLVLAPAVLGQRRVARLAGRADVRGGRALVNLSGMVGGSDRLRVLLDVEPDRDLFDVDIAAQGAPGGVLARSIGARAPVTLDVQGDGRWARWRGTARGFVGDRRIVDLALGADAGRYTVDGALAPATLLRGKIQRLATPRVRVVGAATLADRRLDGTMSLRSASLAADLSGGVDLGANAWRDLRIRARLLRPEALFATMTGRGVALRARLDGAFETAAFTYALAADQLAFGRTGFEQVRASGRGRWSPSPVMLPVVFTAAQVTGVGDVAGGILRNLSVAGRLRIAPPLVTGQGLVLKSDRLTGTLRLLVDLRDGRFDVGIEGGLARYLIPGLGIVDVTSRLQVVPGPGGRGTRVVGRGTAQVVRLDNGFFRSLTGGLPRVEADLERTADGILQFRNLRLTAPQLRLAGQGFRRRDGSVRVEAAGAQGRYGAVQLVLDGRIARPTIDLVFARPNATLGLAAVTAHLDPTPQGFAFRATGASRLGPFAANGAILLPPAPQPASIAIAALDVTGTRAAGTLGIVPGGFAGRLGVNGGGWNGALDLGVEGGVQRIRAAFDLRGARLGSVATVRRGRLELSTLLDPAGARVEATVNGEGLRQGRLSLARFAGTALMAGDTGEIRASLAGSRGRGFDIQSITAVGPGSYAVRAQGTLDGRPIRLLSPALVARDGEGWRVQPTRLSFAGGEAEVAGRFGGAAQSIDARLTRMPLAILDIGYAGLGLGGTASGHLQLNAVAGAAPTGRVDMTVRGLTRSGLVLSSRPIDVGVAGVLGADRLGLRAVAASGGQTIGRAQALLRLGGAGNLAARIDAAPITAQLRYAGPADTLWRLTGVELFDLSGPVRIAADVGGRVGAPVIRGAVQATGARIESAATGTLLTNVQASGRFAGSRLAIDRFAADAGRTDGRIGRVSGTGSFDFAAANGIGLDLALQADRAVMIARDDIGATVSGPLRFRSDGRGGTIAGEVTLDAARYRLGRASAVSAVPRLRVREVNIPGGVGEEDIVPAPPWTLAIRARAERGVSVSGLGLASEWSANLSIGGEPANPAIDGIARLVRGNYEFAGLDFALERGVIRFGGEKPSNPVLDIAANADTTGLSASIRVTGTALTPQIGFASTPALPEDELLSRLLFGTSITNLSAPEALQLAAAVAALNNGGGGLNPINAVRRAAGLDRLRILPADPQTGQGTSVAAGKYVTRRLYAEIVTDGQGYSATRAEFQVTRWLSLLSSISTLGRQSANVRVSRDY